METALAEVALGSLSPGEWDTLAGQQFYSSSTWLRFCARIPGTRAGAVVGRGDGGDIAAMPVYEFSGDAAPLYRWPDLLAERGLPRIPPPGLLAGPLQGYQAHILRSPGGESPQNEAAAVADLLDKVRRAPRSGGSQDTHGCVAMYLNTADVELARAAGVRAMPVLLDTDAWIEVPPDGWDAWLGRFGRKRRVSIRREVRRFEEAGYRVEQLTLADCYEELAALATSTQLKYGHPGGPDDYAAALRRHVEGTGEQARVALCSRDGTGPVGFCLYYQWGDTFFLRWAGFDYKRLADAEEYFNLVYYSQVRLAAQAGVRWLHAGIKAPEAKALRGARLRPLWLLDLAEDSVLTRHSDQIRRHNAGFRDRLLGDPRLAPAVDGDDSWWTFG